MCRLKWVICFYPKLTPTVYHRLTPTTICKVFNCWWVWPLAWFIALATKVRKLSHSKGVIRFVCTSVVTVSNSLITRFGWTHVLLLECQMLHVVHWLDHFIWLESCNCCSLGVLSVISNNFYDILPDKGFCCFNPLKHEICLNNIQKPFLTS